MFIFDIFIAHLKFFILYLIVLKINFVTKGFYLSMFFILVVCINLIHSFSFVSIIFYLIIGLEMINHSFYLEKLTVNIWFDKDFLYMNSLFISKKFYVKYVKKYFLVIRFLLLELYLFFVIKFKLYFFEFGYFVFIH